MSTPATGDIVLYGGPSNAIPANWLACLGQAVSRATYAALFTAIGTTYGAGDGSTTFNVPNLVARFARGIATNPSTTGGAFNHTHTGPTHSHTVTQSATHSTHASQGSHTHDAHGAANRGTTVAVNSTLTAPTTHASGGGHTHDAHPAHSGATADSQVPGATGSNNPPYVSFHHIIRI